MAKTSILKSTARYFLASVLLTLIVGYYSVCTCDACYDSFGVQAWIDWWHFGVREFLMVYGIFTSVIFTALIVLRILLLFIFKLKYFDKYKSIFTIIINKFIKASPLVLAILFFGGFYINNTINEKSSEYSCSGVSFIKNSQVVLK